MKRSKFYSIKIVFVICSILINAISAQENPESKDTEVSQLGINDTYDGVTKGVRVILSYAHNTSMFVGSVENITSELIEATSLQVLLSNGSSLGPTVLYELEPGNKRKIEFNDEGQMFNWWIAHTTLGDRGQKDSYDIDSKSGQIYKTEVGDHNERTSEDINRDRKPTEATSNINRSTDDVNKIEQSNQNIQDAVKSDENVHRGEKSTAEIKNAEKSSDNLQKGEKSTEDEHKGEKSTEDIK